ncbi:MAG: MlaD family protein [Candidatus Fermentibacteraceae bacterium]
MSLQANDFRLGLFFVIAAATFLVIMGWLGGWFGDEESNRYVCYFPWSVQGLEKGSAVRYNGVPVGSVQMIDIAPDGRLVEVQMTINTDFPVRDDLAAHLQFVGITGIKVINLQSRHEQRVTIPEMDFEPQYPVIPVAEGSMETLESALERASEIMNEVDFQGLSDQTSKLLENLNELLESATVEEVAQSIIGAADGVDSLAGVYIDLGWRLQALSDSLAESAPELSGRISVLADRVDSLVCRLDGLAASGSELVDQTWHLMRGLRLIMATVRNHPEELVFGGDRTGSGGWR